MTVSATLPRSQNTITSGNLTSLASDLSSVTFNVTFKYLSTAEVVVTRTDSTGSDTELTETTHYTISPSAGATGTMTFTATGRDLFSADDLLTFTRRMEKAATTFDQLTDYTQNDALDADTLEGNFDKSIMISQQLAEVSSRQIAFSSTATFDSTASKASTITGTAASRQNKLLGFDSAGDISATQDIGTYKGTSATTTTSDYNIRDIVKSTTAGQLNNVYICIKASPSGTALTNTTYWDIIIDAYAASSSATTATNKATEASRSEDNAEAYANTAAETAVTVFGASNAADPTQSGTTTDGYSSLHHREKSKEWATSSSNITDDSGSAISPAVKSAKTYATEAGTSESNASNSETNAAASATAAAASAAAVANALDSFDDKYLGVMADNASATTANLTGAAAAKDSSSITFTGSSGTITVGQELTSTGTGYPSSANIIGTSTTSPITISAPFTTAISSVSLSFVGTGVYGAWDASKKGPSTDNDGNALVNGALYYNSTNGEMRVYDTSSGTWIAASAAQNATVEDFTYTLSGSDATISGSDDNSATLSFSNQESVDVFLNGVKLVPKIGSDANDYHLDTSNTVTLASTAVSGDVILVRVYKTFTVGDAVPASTGGTFSGNVAYTGNIQVDDIIEKSADHGVEIDGVTLKDGGGTFTSTDGAGITVIDSDDKANGYTLRANGTKFQITENGVADSLVLKAGGNVGIGITDPAVTLHLKDATPGISLQADASKTSGTRADFAVYNSAQNTVGLIRYAAETDNFGTHTQFHSRGDSSGALTERVRIESNGNLKILDGDLVIGTAGHGIDFAAQTTSSVSGTTPSTGADEVLDHYEVGTFEPSVSLSTVGDSTCTEKAGTYCRIGDFVSVHGRCRFNKGTTGSGNLSSISGLPFTSFTLSGYQSAGSSASIGGGATHYIEKLRLDTGTNIVSFSLYPQSTSTSGVAFSPSNMASSFYIRFSLQYRCAA